MKHKELILYTFLKLIQNILKFSLFFHSILQSGSLNLYVVGLPIVVGLTSGSLGGDDPSARKEIDS